LKLLEQGTLYAARFNPDGSGEWLPLVHGQGGLDQSSGFAGQAEVLVHARAAADVVRPTKMDRPEWIAMHPQSRDMYVTLTNNSSRGVDKGPALDPPNPRPNNVFGHIMRWKESGADAAATRFSWDILRPLRRSREQGRGQARQHQGRHLRVAGRPLVRHARRALDPDRRLDIHPPQG
jgi:secreted PhoX family phosphatase